MEDIKDRIAKKIIGISSAHAPYDIFFDIVQSCVFSLANSFEKRHSEKWENTERRYKAIAQKYTPDEFRKFAEVWALWIELADQNWREQQKFHDNLGPVYQALQMSNKHAGQFFTPEHVALLMAILTWDKEQRKKDIDTAGFTTLNEPTCGAGVNLLMGAQVMLGNGYNPQQQLLIYGSDIDFKCVCMTYLQLAIYGIPALLKHQDTLTEKTYSTWKTPQYFLGGWDWRLKLCQIE